MPYIVQVRRHELADAVDGLTCALQELPGGPGPGDLNYCVTMLMGVGLEQVGHNYRGINELIGILECAKLELYRRLAGPYEDEKKLVYGDLGIYSENVK